MRLTKKVHKHFSVAKIAIALIVSYGLTNQVSAQDDELVLQITTKLGAQVQVKIHKSGSSSNLPESLYEMLDDLDGSEYQPHESKIVLDQGSGLFVLIPWQIFKSSVTNESLQTVTLKDGTKYSGKLLTTVVSKSDAGLEKTYDLASLNKIDLVSVKPLSEEKNKDTDKSGQNWVLRINNPTEQSFEVLAPCFIFPYQKKSFMGDIFIDSHKTDAFYLKVNEEDIAANLSDFEAVEFQEKDLMTVIGAGGQKTSGTLKLIVDDDGKKKQPMNGQWMLVSETKNGCILVSERPIGKITKMAQSKQEVTQQSTSESQQKTESTQPDTSKAIPIKSKHIGKIAFGVAFDKDDQIIDPLPWPISFPTGTTQFSFQLVVDSEASGVSLSIDGLEDQGGYQVTNHDKYGIVMGRPKKWQYGATFNRADGKPFTSKIYKLNVTINGETETIPFGIGSARTSVNTILIVSLIVVIVLSSVAVLYKRHKKSKQELPA